MSLCVATAGTVLTLLASSFSLSWVHSVEKTAWVEHWQVQGERLLLTSASVEGSGAGIELPPNAVWEKGRWTYRPDLPPLPSLSLAASGQTASAWHLCAEGTCHELGRAAGEEVLIWAADFCEPTPRRGGGAPGQPVR